MIGRVIGLDYGDRRVGVAVSDVMRVVSTPVSTLEHNGWKQLWEPLKQLEAEYDPSSWVIGLPLHMDGGEGDRAERTHAFIAAFKEHTTREIILWDERLSTAEARRAMDEVGVKQDRRKELVDQLAAQLILQSWLDAQAPPMDF